MLIYIRMNIDYKIRPSPNRVYSKHSPPSGLGPAHRLAVVMSWKSLFPTGVHWVSQGCALEELAFELCLH